MPLQGSLKDFSLADIFQLIGLQKKIGILVLRDELDEIKILFDRGMIVGADSRLKKIEDRIGQLLVRSGKITREQLSRALDIQKETLQQLGYVLIENDMITLPELKEALQKQILQIIYRMFRWKKGEYEFYTKNAVDYNRDFIEPTPAEKILMEGIRMLDEWPLIEQVIPTYDIIFKKVMVEQDLLEKTSEKYLVDTDDVLDGMEVPDADARLKNLDPRQARIYDLIDGSRDINAIIEISPFNEFETCKTIVELEKMYLIEKSDIIIRQDIEEPSIAVHSKKSAGFSIKTAHPALIYLLITLLLGFFFIASDMHLPSNVKMGIDNPAMMNLETGIRESYIKEALRLYHLVNSSYPDILEELASRGFIDEKILSRQGRFLFQYNKENLLYDLERK